MSIGIMEPQISSSRVVERGSDTLSMRGVTLSVLGTSGNTDGKLTFMDYTVPAGFTGPIPHWHKVITECFYVLEGTLTFRMGERTFDGGPGTFVSITPGVVHAFSNRTEEPVRFLIAITPAGFENYFRELFALMKSEVAWPPEDPSGVIALAERYDTFTPTSAA